MSNSYFDIYYHNNKNKHRFCFRSGEMVYEEVFTDNALLSAGWNASGYPLNVLKNCPTHLNSKRYAEPFSYNIELDGQSVDFNLEFVDFKTEKTEAKTASGIIIPDTAQEKTQVATVIAIGDDKEKIKVVPGQKVMYDKYSGTPVKIDGEDHLILKAADVIAVIE